MGSKTYLHKNDLVIPALNGLRAVAALMIFVHHYFAGHPRLPFLLGLLVAKMHVGLILFFVLTGFLITFRYFPATTTLTTRYLKEYYQNRFIRVYPLYFILTLIILFWQQVTDWRVWAVNFSLSKGLFSNYKFSGLAQAWSLTVVEMFYLFAPLLQIWIKKNNNPMWLLFPAYGAGLLLVLISSFLGLSPFIPSVKFLFIYTVFGHAFSFLFGAWCNANLSRFRKYQNKVSGLFTYGSLLGFGVLFSIWAVLTQEHAFFSAHEYGGIIITDVLFGALAGMLIVGLTLERTWVSKILSTKPIDLLGRSSYAFFLLNMGFFADLTYRYIGHNPIAVLLVTGGISVLVHLYFERPIMKRFGGARVLRPDADK